MVAGCSFFLVSHSPESTNLMGLTDQNVWFLYGHGAYIDFLCLSTGGVSRAVFPPGRCWKGVWES